MNWLESLVNFYDENAHRAGDYSIADKPHKILVPIFHAFNNAHIEISLDKRGKFVDARVIPLEDRVTLMPQTLSSIGSRTTMPAPKALFDNLRYLAKDLSSHFDIKESNHYENYKKALEAWTDDENCPDKVKAIFTYIVTSDIIQDLIDVGIFLEDENKQLLNKPTLKENIPLIYTSKYSPGASIDKATVRFRVDMEDGTPADVWKDTDVQKKYIEYYTALLYSEYKTEYICPISRQKDIPMRLASKEILFPGSNGKLFSSNDSSTYVFRGNYFSDKDELNSMGAITEQKITCALRWLCRNQYFTSSSEDTGKYIVWGIDDVKRITGSTSENPDIDDIILSLENSEPAKMNSEKRSADAFKRKMAGFNVKQEHFPIHILRLDAPIPGRLSVCYSMDFIPEEFYRHVTDWHKKGAWKQFGKNGLYFGVPSPYSLASIITSDGDRIDSPAHQNYVYDVLLKSMLEGHKIPRSLIQEAMRKVSKNAALLRPEKAKTMQQTLNSWSIRQLYPLCSLITLHLHYDKKENVYSMALDHENLDRSYLFGRLVACAEKIEVDSLKKEEKRTPMTLKFLPRFLSYPAQTWRMILTKITPYLDKRISYKDANGKNSSYRHEREWGIINKIQSEMLPEDFCSKKPLQMTFFLGYSAQKEAFYVKKEKTEEKGE